MRIGIIGLGAIGEVVVQSFQKFLFGVEIIASVQTSSRLENLKSNSRYKNITILTDNCVIPCGCDQVYLCVKPLQAMAICEEIKDCIEENTVVISVMAAVSLEKLRNWLGEDKKILRIMPTITASYNGPVVVYDPTNLNPRLPFFPLYTMKTEDELDKFTGESGCIPGFLSFIFEGWIEALIALGISPALAEKIFIQNLVAYTQMIDGDPTKDHLIDIRQHVTSRAGATEKGLDKLRNANLFSLFLETMKIANDRVDEVKHMI